MSKTCIPLSVNDISVLARALREQLVKCDHTPSHVELLNMLARSTGHRNFQSLRAQAVAQHLLQPAQTIPKPIDHSLIKRLLRRFDAQGRLATWPAKFTLQELCLWVLWSKLPPRCSLTEAEVNVQIEANHLFGDYALLRRELCDHALVARSRDGREYRRVERRPPPEAILLIRQLAAREPGRIR
jgi:hypothetical protein